MDAEGYDEYVGSAPLLTVRFQYPAGWSLQEEQGQQQPFRQVRIMGPRNADETYRCYLAVLATPMAAAGGAHASVEEMARQYAGHLQRDAQVVASQDASLAGAKGRDLTVSYTQSAWRFHGVHQPGPVPVKVRTLLLQKGATLYQLTLSADAREYERYAPVFERLLRSFQFQ